MEGFHVSLSDGADTAALMCITARPALFDTQTKAVTLKLEWRLENECSSRCCT